MKVPARLRRDVAGGDLDAAALASLREIALEEAFAVRVAVFDGEPADGVEARLEAAGATVLGADDGGVTAIAPAEVLLGLAHDQAVESLLPFRDPEPSNDRARAVMGGPGVAGAGPSALTGAGQIVAVADSGIDTGVATTLHPDLRGRVTIRSSPNQRPQLASDPAPFDDGASDEQGHGTHVAGSIAGDGSAARAAGSPTLPLGVAPEAALHFTAVGQRVRWKPASFPPGKVPKPWGYYGTPSDLARLFAPAHAAGARIMSNSWGNPGPEVAGSYSDESRQVDRFCFDHRDVLILFAAGNAGLDRDGDGSIDAGSVSPPATAKSCLTVGASENDRPHGSLPTPGRDVRWVELTAHQPSGDVPVFAGFAAAGHMSDDPDGMALFSSRGPTDDGRVKPEVVAPGTNVLSLLSAAFDPVHVGLPPDAQPLSGGVTPPDDPLAARYCWSGGSSMATPLVAGLAALVRQHLVELGHVRDGVAPSGALMRAMIVNGALPMAGQYAGEIPSARPNNVNGFGRVSAAEALAPKPLGRPAFSDDPALALPSGDVRVFTARPLDPSRPLRVTLAWTDPPSPRNAGVLQNALYLRVVPPGGAPVDGDVAPFPRAENPVQQVVIPAPIAGDHEVRVHATSVSRRSAAEGAPAGVVQDFALVASNVAEITPRPAGP